MEIDDLARRLDALRDAIGWHVVATDAVLRGHADIFISLLETRLDAMPPEERATPYGMDLQRLKIACLPARQSE